MGTRYYSPGLSGNQLPPPTKAYGDVAAPRPQLECSEYVAERNAKVIRDNAKRIRQNKHELMSQAEQDKLHTQLIKENEKELAVQAQKILENAAAFDANVCNQISVTGSGTDSVDGDYKLSHGFNDQPAFCKKNEKILQDEMVIEYLGQKIRQQASLTFCIFIAISISISGCTHLPAPLRMGSSNQIPESMP